MDKYQAMREAHTLARQLGHELGQFVGKGVYSKVEKRAECTHCGAEVFVSAHSGTWERFPGWEIQHQCTGERE